MKITGKSTKKNSKNWIVFSTKKESLISEFTKKFYRTIFI